MKKARCLLAVLLTTALLLPGLAGCGESPAQQACNRAKNLQRQALYTRAIKEYEKARGLYVKEGKPALAAGCRDRAQSLMLVALSYPDLAGDLRAKLAEMYPQVPKAEREKWITSGEVEHRTWDGKVHYFSQAAENIATRHFDIAYQNTPKSQTIADLVKSFEPYIEQQAVPWQPYSNPMTWLGTETIDIPRGELPKTGLLKLWFPLPVETGPQDAVTLLSVTPDTWLKQPASLSGNLSDAYCEVPLDRLESDLKITVQFQFTHYQENFKVDPDNVGSYDRSSPLYKHYTRSYGNTFITPGIRATAKKVVGAEKNPYLQARKLYDYVLKDIKYSLMPHAAAWPRGQRESVYVHRLKRGDCGAQSMYFSALCRSLGIPARTTGGWQLFTGQFAGHFWGEFFLPNYGWIPVDPTAADIADWTDRITEQEKDRFKDFFFGNQDPLRCNVQLDVDERFVPPADGEVLIPLAMQEPVGTCSESQEPITIVISEHTIMSAQLLSGSTSIKAGGPVHGN